MYNCVHMYVVRILLQVILIVTPRFLLEGRSISGNFPLKMKYQIKFLTRCYASRLVYSISHSLYTMSPFGIHEVPVWYTQGPRLVYTMSPVGIHKCPRLVYTNIPVLHLKIRMKKSLI